MCCFSTEIEQLDKIGYAEFDEKGDFESGLQYFLQIRSFLGVSRNLKFLRTLNTDSTINVIESFGVQKRRFGDVWHQDHAFEVNPPKYTILFCVICPSKGGETQILDRCKVFNSLNEKQRVFLKNNKFNVIAPKELRAKVSPNSPIQIPKSVSGVLEMGESLNINISPYHTSVVDNPQIQKDLKCIYNHYDCHGVTLAWQKYKIIVWNNFRVFHRALNNTSQKRIMFRSVIDQ